MHEVGIMQSTLALAEQQARRSGASHIHSLRLRIGRLSGVVRDSLEYAFEVLRQEAEDAGKASQFQHLRDFLTGAEPSGSYKQSAEQLGMTEGAVKTAVHRLRRRFKERLRGEIAQTVSTEEDVDDEIRHLFEVLRG